MDDKQIEQLKDVLDDGNFQVYYISDSSVAKQIRQIIRVSIAPIPQADEP